ncbi:hypothetical protein ACFWYW_51880 [Nonomuraea sp. NPDC059023]|uniref:hypothetical protein n=1 Tax=unclassified Nonomuraea TaxID=2593643 RepID=UPI00367A4F38
MSGELIAWLVRHAPARLRASGAPEHLSHVVRLIGLPWQDRALDPYWADRKF